MSIIAIILSLLIGFLIVVLIFLLSQSFHFKYTESKTIAINDLPFVSLLIAMRNEEQNILECLSSIKELDYPSEKFEVLIGDDNSEDNSYTIVENFINNNDELNIKLYKITSQINHQHGKTNVLAHLCKKASGELLAFTDADIELSPTWLKSMVEQMDEGYGIISGVTAVKDNSWQNIDWLYSIGMVKTISDLNVPITSLGNNMMIRKLAYDEIGGFENLEYSITEDYAIFQKIVKKHKYKNLYHKEVLANSKSAKGIFNLLMQRKRWMTGAVQLPWQIFGILGFQALYFPLIIALVLVNPKAAAFLFWAKYIFQTLYISILLVKLRQKISFFALLFYEVYSSIVSTLLLLFYILPIKIKWKGRTY